MSPQGLTGATIKSKLLSSDVYLAALSQTSHQSVQTISLSQLFIHRISTCLSVCSGTGTLSKSLL